MTEPMSQADATKLDTYCRAAYAELAACTPNPRDFARSADSDWLTPFTRVSAAYQRMLQLAAKTRETAAHLARCEAARAGKLDCPHAKYLRN